MTNVIQKVRCNCGCILGESPNISSNERTPCPDCGSLNRAFQINVSETIYVHPLLKLHHKIPGFKKPQAEITSGEDLHRDSGRWMIIERVLDRGKNWYKEIIRDLLTDEISHQTDEPLDKHIGHGSAKYKKK